MTSDCTCLFYTANRTAPAFMAHVTRLLLEAIGDMPLIAVSQAPMPDFGHNICLGDIGQSYLNIYRQILIGAKAATTPYVAFAEDDILYPPSHFTCYRPPLDAVAYDMHKWSLLTWRDPPVFVRTEKQRMTTGCIAPRALLIDALEERFAKYPDDSQIDLAIWGEVGRAKYERLLGVTEHKAVEFSAPDPHVVFFHEAAVGYTILGNRKKPGPIQVHEIPYWSTASDIMRLHHG